MPPSSARPQPRKPPPFTEADPAQIQSSVGQLHHFSGLVNLLPEFQDLFNSQIPLQALDIYLHQTLEAAGQPTDPILRMLIEQFVAANHKISRLNRMSAAATSVEAARAYDASSVALLGEMRRLALSIKTYREPTSQTHVTLVKQQNVAQNQQVAYVEKPALAGEDAKPDLPDKGRDTELTSNGKLEHVPSTTIFSQSSPCSSRETQPAFTKRPPRGG